MLDELDVALLKSCKTKSGKSLKEIVAPCLQRRSNKTLRTRLNRLEALGYIRIDRTKERGRALCYVTDFGEEYLREHESSHPEGGELQ